MNNAKNKKRSGIITGALAVAFAVPVIALAVVYLSRSARNNFNSSIFNMNVKIEENDSKAEEIAAREMTFKLSDTGKYSAEKQIKIVSEERSNDSELRVKIVPVWYTEGGDTVCGNIGNYSDFRYQRLDEDTNELKFMNVYNDVIFTCKLDEHWDEYWEYNNVYEAFVYKSVLEENEQTSTLVSSIEMIPAVYEATKGYELHIDVIADTIQVYDEASDKRWK